MKLSVHALKKVEKIHFFLGGGGGEGEGGTLKMEKMLFWTCEDMDVTLLAKQILYFLPTPIPPPSSISELSFGKHG